MERNTYHLGWHDPYTTGTIGAEGFPGGGLGAAAAQQRLRGKFHVPNVAKK